MDKDIVERLRAEAGLNVGWSSKEAAAQIERLQDELQDRHDDVAASMRREDELHVALQAAERLNGELRQAVAQIQVAAICADFENADPVKIIAEIREVCRAVLDSKEKG